MTQDFRSPGFSSAPAANVRLRHPRAADVRHRMDCRSGRSRRVRPVSLLWRRRDARGPVDACTHGSQGSSAAPQNRAGPHRSDRPGCRQSTASLGADPAAHRVLRRRVGLAGTGRRAERDRRRDAGAGMGSLPGQVPGTRVSRSSCGWPSWRRLECSVRCGWAISISRSGCTCGSSSGFNSSTTSSLHCSSSWCTRW